MTPRLLLVVAACVCADVRSAAAEGSTQLGTRLRLHQDTVLFVDIIDPSTETITWAGQGTVAVRDPNNALVATLSTGQSASLTGRLAGAYLLDPGTTQGIGVTWDVRVNNPVTPGGRLSSTNWHLVVGDTAFPGASFSMYARAPGAAPSTHKVIELEFRGIQGDNHNLIANQRGVNGPHGSRSTLTASNVAPPQLPLYLTRPALAVESSTAVSVTDFGFSADGSDGGCGVLVPGLDGGAFRFTSNASGTYQLVCDLSGDLTFNRVDATDLLLTGTALPGVNLVPWNGVDRQGAPLMPGTYRCRVDVIVGEVHLIASDVETLFPGLRAFDVTTGTARLPLNMFWDDTLVQAGDVLMPAPTNAVGLPTSGSAGLSSGAPSDATAANVNAHSWGNFSTTSKGKNAFIDTFVFAESATSPTLMVFALDPVAVADGGVCPSCASTLCGGRGTCSTTGTCACSSGFAGSSCQYSDSATCNAHGAAQADAGCECAIGFAGAGCTACAMNFYNYPTCTPCQASTTCSGHGGCTALGTCSCAGGFAGASCQFSDAVTCNARGASQADGGCLCMPSFAGSTCGECAPDRYGYPTCTPCSAATSCSGHGMCDALGGCACDAGFAGSSCQFSDSVTCNAHGVANSDAGCLCALGFAGAACGECAPNHFDFPACRQCDATTCLGTCSSLGLCEGLDGGTRSDAGEQPDSGAFTDAGVAVDSGTSVEADGGPVPDAGARHDGGAFADAGGSLDSGTRMEADAGAPPTDGGTGGESPSPGCGCSTDFASMAMLGVAALLRRRRATSRALPRRTGQRPRAAPLRSVTVRDRHHHEQGKRRSRRTAPSHTRS